MQFVINFTRIWFQNIFFTQIPRKIRNKTALTIFLHSLKVYRRREQRLWLYILYNIPNIFPIWQIIYLWPLSHNQSLTNMKTCHWRVIILSELIFMVCIHINKQCVSVYINNVIFSEYMCTYSYNSGNKKMKQSYILFIIYETQHHSL